ncbi:MAG TPA: cytochrome c3 family protein [Desulfosporosinus sp.]|nr:cytochrome c3 family protein [Desulfosporosinus sp.]
MKKAKHFILGVGLLSMIALVAVGCGTTTPTPVPKVEAPKIVATYAGDDTCKACHEGKDTAYHTTKHSKTVKPLADFPLNTAVTNITVFDGADEANLKGTELDLSKAKIYGVMMNEYLLAEVPGFKSKVYRVAKVTKVGDKYDLEAAKAVDVDKDGKPDWQAADATSCIACHAPGALVASPTPGISCESCHGPGSIHVSAPAEKKKGSIMAQPSSTMPNSETCLTCHASNPSKDKTTGVFTTDNHHGTRDYFSSKHVTSGQVNGCFACHTAHKANANGATLNKDNAAEICLTCHANMKYDVEKIMWKNPTDARNHITSDHSFGAMKYEDLGDDLATKPIEITNPAMIDLIKKALPDLAK